ncbi:SLC13/DASS family transporter [Alkalicaulis satelles]|uniref:SLC13/DASS family transporter n=1 Tax=Alkalicaulis satelles TaxID=2609175 RepID=A0A5M6ZFL9_9PROT|nr:SLC13 family permease [Alkalicaulis satelles]KAA5803552.1 SLC13/DASS family transporter [Alkalicaulis satelles]
MTDFWTSKRIGLITGLVLALVIQLIPVPEGLTREAWIVASIAAMMASWWATEAIPIAATALVPLALFPMFGVLSTRAAAEPYADPIVMLLLGGFIIALAIERWNLHARIALNVVARFGGRPSLMIAGFMLASAILSMWISNTATTLMMIPIALKVAEKMADEGVDLKMFAPALALAVAYAASVGGLATPVGTPTNLIAIGFLEREFEASITFVEWMMLGVPAVAVILPVMWLILTRFAFKVSASAPNAAGHEEVLRQKKALGRMSAPEWRVAVAFGTVAVLWMGRELPGALIFRPEISFGWNPLLGWLSDALALPVRLALSDAQIAILGAVAVFLIPAGGRDNRGQALMDWETVQRLPWAAVILFGGGLSLAAAIQATGLAGWIGAQLSWVTALPLPVTVLILALMVVFLTELTSNVATVSGFLPVLAALALEAGVPPAHLIAPLALAASCAFMLPVATAPNAIVYASGAASMGQMIRAGFRINLAAAPVIALLASLLSPLVFPG